MDNQLRTEIERIKERDTLQQKKRDWQQFKASTIEANMPALWMTIVRLVESLVVEFNACFAADPFRRCEFRKAERDLSIHKSCYPAVKVDVGCNLQQHSIECRVVETLDFRAAPVDSEMIFDVDLAEDGNLYIKENEHCLSPKEFAERLLITITQRI